jgi:hypothetical protein
MNQTRIVCALRMLVYGSKLTKGVPYSSCFEMPGILTPVFGTGVLRMLVDNRHLMGQYLERLCHAHYIPEHPYLSTARYRSEIWTGEWVPGRRQANGTVASDWVPLRGYTLGGGEIRDANGLPLKVPEEIDA